MSFISARATDATNGWCIHMSLNIGAVIITKSRNSNSKRKHINLSSRGKRASLVPQQAFHPVDFDVLRRFHLALMLAFCGQLAQRIWYRVSLLEGVVDLFERRVAGNEHVHVHVCVVVQAQVALHAEGMAHIILALANPALPFVGLRLLNVLLFTVLRISVSSFTELSLNSFGHFWIRRLFNLLYLALRISPIFQMYNLNVHPPPSSLKRA